MKVRLTPTARRDLAEIGGFIAQDNPRRARSFVKELAAKAHDVGRSPHGFQPVERYEALGIRRRPYGAYLIFYRVKDDHVEIIHILHGARDYEALLSSIGPA